MNQSILKQKEAVVNEISDLMKKSAATVVCEYRGLTVDEITTLRRDLREKNAVATVYKNSLVTRAAESCDHKDFDEYLSGPNMYIFFEDYTNGSLRSVAKFAKKYDAFSIKGGIIENKVCDADYVKQIAALPSKEGLVSMLLSVLQAPMRNLAYSLSQVSEKK